LALLASIPYGVTEDLPAFAHGFDPTMIAGRDRYGPSRRVIKVVRIKISDAGRRALDG
jgi:hypothetical protein